MTTAEYIRNTAEFESITYTRDELANTFDAIEKGALLDAADTLWEGLKMSVEAYWEAVERIMDETDSKYARVRDRKTERLSIRLHTYEEAFEALGCELHVTYDWCPKVVYKVTLTYDNCVRGCICNS